MWPGWTLINGPVPGSVWYAQLSELTEAEDDELKVHTWLNLRVAASFLLHDRRRSSVGSLWQVKSSCPSPPLRLGLSQSFSYFSALTTCSRSRQLVFKASVSCHSGKVRSPLNKEDRGERLGVCSTFYITLSSGVGDEAAASSSLCEAG